MTIKGEKIICIHSGKVLKENSGMIQVKKGDIGEILDDEYQKSVIAQINGSRVKILNNHINQSSIDDIFACFKVVKEKSTTPIINENVRRFLKKKKLHENEECEYESTLKYREDNIIPKEEIDYGKLYKKVEDWNKTNKKLSKDEDKRIDDFDHLGNIDNLLKIEEAKKIKKLISRIEMLSKKQVHFIK